jgi:hypothetical protein
MEMEQLKKNKLFWVLVIVTVFNVGAFVIGKVIVDKAADRVIQKLQKDYSPSPYGPGFDPDRVSPDAINGVRKYYELRQRTDSKIFSEEKLREVDNKTQIMAVEADRWRGGWEASRGVNP